MTDFEKTVKEVAKALYGPGHVLDPDLHCAVTAMANKLLNAAKVQIIKEGGIIISLSPSHGCDPGLRGPSGDPDPAGVKAVEELKTDLRRDRFGVITGEDAPDNFELMEKINEIIQYLNCKRK